MPFGMELEVEGPPLEIVTDTPRGNHIHSISEKKIARFSGLIDLVVAFKNPEKESSLLPVDLKTEDARILLESKEHIEGTLLETISDGSLSAAEREILMKHRHQLFIYHYALELQEENRASNGMQRRIVEFPAIWVGVSGRLVQMNDEIMSLAKSELHPLLNEMIAIDYGANTESKEYICSEDGYHKCHF